MQPWGASFTASSQFEVKTFVLTIHIKSMQILADNFKDRYSDPVKN